MNLTADRRHLLAAAAAVAPAVPGKALRESLACLKLEAAAGTLTVTAFDGEVGVAHRTPLSGPHAGGACLVPADTFHAILRECDAEAVTLSADADRVAVAAGGARFELPARPAAEFPELPVGAAGGPHHEVGAAALRFAIGRVAFAADRRDGGGRFALKGVLWEAEGAVARLVATDGKRLALCEAPAAVRGGDQADPKKFRIVPPKAISLLLRNLADADGPVRVTLRDADAVFRTGHATITAALVAGRFAPYRDVFPRQFAHAFALDPAALAAAVRRAAVVTDGESRRVEFAFSAGRVRLAARAAGGAAEAELDAPGVQPRCGVTVEVALDAVLLLDYLHAVADAAGVTLRITDGEKPAVFDADGGSRFLLMPLAAGGGEAGKAA